MHAGLQAQITLSAYTGRNVPKLIGEVTTVSADALLTEEGGQSFFFADVRIPREELQKLPEGVRMYPGMPAVATIRTGRRTIMSYLLGPIGSTLGRSMLEQ